MDKKEWINAEREYHNEKAEYYLVKYGNAKQHQIPEEIFLFHYLPRDKKFLIVDIGCGPSISISRTLKKFETLPTYIGIDISERLINIARKNLPSGYFIIADGSELPLKTSVADYIVSLGSLHHIPDLENTITSLLRILKPGGYLLLREPSEEAFHNWAGDSPMERGIDPERLILIAQRQKAIVVDYRRFNSGFFNSLRHILHISRLYHLFEWSDTYWKIKSYLDSFLDRKFGRKYFCFKGQDFCIVIRKTIR